MSRWYTIAPPFRRNACAMIQRRSGGKVGALLALHSTPRSDQAERVAGFDRPIRSKLNHRVSNQGLSILAQAQMYSNVLCGILAPCIQLNQNDATGVASPKVTIYYKACARGLRPHAPMIGN